MFETLYALILRLYPVGFRKEYGDEALLLFRDRRLHERGVLGALRLWFDIALEFVPSLLYEYDRETGDTNEPQTNGGPALCLLKGGQPNPRALAAGALVSLMLLAGFAVLLQFAPGNIAPTLRWMRGLGLGFASGPGEQYRFAYVTGPPEPHPVGVSRMWSHLLAMIPVNLHPGRPAAPVQADDSGPLFESITIQAGSSNDNGAIRLSAAGAFSAENVSLRRLMRWAFQVDDFQILGAPSWLDSEKFRISAKAPANTDRSRAGAMLQNALRDRFHLQLSWLPRTTPVYILEAAAGGRRPKATEDFVEGPSRVIVQDCQAKLDFGPGATTLEFANFLSHQPSIRLPVIDQTGWSNSFELQFNWSTPCAATAAPFQNVQTALWSQLGLRLRQGVTTVGFLAVKQIERPGSVEKPKVN